MINEIIDQYEKKSDLWIRIFSKMKIRVFLFNISPLFCLVYPLISKIVDLNWWPTISMVIIIIPELIFGVILNSAIKRRLNIKKRFVLWNSKNVYEQLKEDDKLFLTTLLQDKKCYCSKKIELIENEVIKKIKPVEKIKIFPFAIGLLLFPIWDHYLSYLNNIFSNPDYFNELVKYTSVSLLLVIMFGLLFVIVKNAIMNYYDYFFKRHQNNLLRLVDLLNEIKIDLILESET